jgi:hypothetical protein
MCSLKSVSARKQLGAHVYNFCYKANIRHNSDELYASVDRGYMDYDTREFVDCELTMWRHGTFEGFKI